jgi:hypothetical protein
MKLKHIALVTFMLPTLAFAQQATYFTDRNGLPAGTAWSYGNQTFLTDSIGRPMGSAATNTNRAPPAAITMPIEPLRIEPLRIEPLRIEPLRIEPLPLLTLPSLR